MMLSFALNQRYYGGKGTLSCNVPFSYSTVDSSINATSLMEALIISPPAEVSFFANREKFDYVVLYDWNSTSFGPLDSPLSVLVQTIYEREFTRMLKHAPIILVGGLEAWKREFGEAEVTKGDGEVVKPPSPSTETETFVFANPPTPQLSAKNPLRMVPSLLLCPRHPEVQILLSSIKCGLQHDHVTTLIQATIIYVNTGRPIP